MDILWKAVAATLLCTVLGLTLGAQQRDFSLVLSVTVCCMVVWCAGVYIEPVLAFLRELEELTGLSTGVMTVLMKAVGIGLVTNLTEMICRDAGNGSLAKGLQTLGSSAILYLSLPLFRGVLDLIRELLEMT